jgi:hypothetical protein
MVNHTFDTLAILEKKGKPWLLACEMDTHAKIKLALALLKTCKLELSQRNEGYITGHLGYREELIFVQANVPKHVVEVLKRIADIKTPIRVKWCSNLLKNPTVESIESLLEIHAVLN